MRFVTGVITKGYHRYIFPDVRLFGASSLSGTAAGKPALGVRFVSGDVGVGDPASDQQRRTKAKADWEQNLTTIRLKVCSSLYQEWFQRSISYRKPLSGVEYDVVYADTWPRAPSHTPVVIGLHGTAASHLYFSSLASFLATRGVRFIVPNFPGCGFTQMDKEGVFAHSPRERANFALDVLKAIGISKVSVVVAHSAAAYPAMILCKQSDAFCSIALVNPGTHRGKWLSTFKLYKFILRLIDLGVPLRPLTYKYISKYGKNLPGSQHGAEAFEVGARSMIFNDYDEMYALYQELKFQRLPLLYAYSRNDKVFPEEMFNDLADQLEFKSSNMFLYNAKAQLTQTGNVLHLGRYAHGMVFDKGGHSILNVYPDILEKGVFDLLTYVRNKSS